MGVKIERFPEKKLSVFKVIQGVIGKHPIKFVLTLILAAVGVFYQACGVDFQRKDFIMRNRPILSIPVSPSVQLDTKNRPQTLLYNIKNLSDIPATNVSVVSEIFVDGKSVERLGPTYYSRVDKENPLQYMIDCVEETKGKYVRVKILIWYEGMSEAVDSWFEAGLEELFLLDYKTVTAHYPYEKSHWGEKRPNTDSDIYQTFLDMRLSD